MSIKDLVIGSVVSVVIGGTAYTVSQADVVTNFASDTGMSQQQAEEYVNGVGEDDLVPYDELGADYVRQGQELLTTSSQIDCVNYEYEWETSELTCEAGKAQLYTTGNDEVSLGNAFKKLATDSATKGDISYTISFLNKLNGDYELGIVSTTSDRATVDEAKKSNSYNKAVLQAALDKN